MFNEFFLLMTVAGKRADCWASRFLAACIFGQATECFHEPGRDKAPATHVLGFLLAPYDALSIRIIGYDTFKQICIQWIKLLYANDRSVLDFGSFTVRGKIEIELT